jgi:hypothetical protein
MNTLLIKLIMMPLVIGGVTLASKKWGNQIGGMIASLPWIAGPIILFFMIEQGIDFTVSSIKGVMIGVIGVLAFCFAYIYACMSYKWYWSLLLAYTGFLTSSLTFNAMKDLLSLNEWYIFTIILSLISVKIFPKLKSENSHSKALKYDIYLRMIVITTFVTLLTFLASILGPTWSGILTPFPIITAILSAFTHYTQGPYGTSIALRGLLSGIIGFSSFLFLQAILLPIYPIVISFAIGLIVNLLLNFLMQYLVKRVV